MLAVVENNPLQFLFVSSFNAGGGLNKEDPNNRFIEISVPVYSVTTIWTNHI